MNLKAPLVLPILWNTKEASVLTDLGLESDIEPIKKNVYFYTVDHIFEANSSTKEKPVTVVISGGDEYLVEDTLGSVNAAIIERL